MERLNAFGDTSLANDVVLHGTELTAADSLLLLGDSNNSSDAADIGFIGKYYSSGVKYAGLYRDATDGVFKFMDGITSLPANNVISGGSLAGLSMGALSMTEITIPSDSTISGLDYHFKVGQLVESGASLDLLDFVIDGLTAMGGNRRLRLQTSFYVEGEQDVKYSLIHNNAYANDDLTTDPLSATLMDWRIVDSTATTTITKLNVTLDQFNSSRLFCSSLINGVYGTFGSYYGTSDYFHLLIRSGGGGGTFCISSVDSGDNAETIFFKSSNPAIANVSDYLAQIAAASDATSGGKLSFSTSAPSTGTMSEVMRLDSAGDMFLYYDATHYGQFSVNAIGQLTINGSNSLLFQTNGVDAMSISLAGNFGVGLATAATKFHIHEASSGQVFLNITNDTTGSLAGNGLEIGLDASENAYVWNYEATSLKFGTSDATRMTITSGGAMLVGTSDLGWYKAQIGGSWSGSNDGNNTVGFIADALFNTTYDKGGVYTSWIYPNFSPAVGTTITNAMAMRIDSGSGNLGSGSITNAYGLYVGNPTSGTNNYCAYFGGNVGIGGTSSNRLLVKDTTPVMQFENDGVYSWSMGVSSTNFHLAAGSAITFPSVIVTSGGDMSIGGTSPTGKLDVYDDWGSANIYAFTLGTGQHEAHLRLSRKDSAAALSLGMTTDKNAVIQAHENGVGYYDLYLNPAGTTTVYVGSAYSSTTLEVTGEVRTKTTTQSNYWASNTISGSVLGPYDFKYTRAGRAVTCFLPQGITTTTGTGADIFEMVTAVPVGLRPTTTCYFPVRVINGGTSAIGFAMVSTSGAIDIYASGSGGVFTNSASDHGIYATTLQWWVD